MNLSIHHAFLPHIDAEASLAFYRDVLGFSVVNDVGYGDMRWITMAPPGSAGATLVLQPPTADPGITDDERRVIAEMMAKGTYGMLVLSSDDLETAFARIQTGDVEIVQEPMDQPYGVRDCALRDPAGNMVRIQQTS
ncbi:MAG: VOC family protein [Ilumatobacteraceae bacterium]